MKLLVLLTLSLFIYADEIQRIDSIVSDITKLRAEYDECKKALAKKSTQQQTLKVRSTPENKCECKKEKLKIENLKQLVINKDIEINNLKNKINTYRKILKKQKRQFDNPNKFPKLMLKKKYLQEEEKSKKIQKFKADSFRLLRDSVIYDAVDGTRILEWEKHTTFTSDTKVENWMKITGYFVDKKWRKAKKNLWIQTKNIARK